MVDLVWQQDLATGIGVIDDQHRRIADMVNALEHARATGSHAEVGEVLDEMIDYTPCRTSRSRRR